MKNTLKPLLACLGLVAAMGPVAAGESETHKSNCAFVQMINNFKYVDDRTAIFETGPSRKYKVTFFSACRDLKWANAVRVEARPGVCLSSGDVVVVSRDGVIPERCFVDKVEALPAADASEKADPAQK
jgi:hypothetical protein